MLREECLAEIQLGRCHAIKRIVAHAAKSMQIEERHKNNKNAADEQIYSRRNWSTSKYTQPSKRTRSKVSLAERRDTSRILRCRWLRELDRNRASQDL